MPLYEFRCPSGHDFEKFYRSISSAPSVEKCPECGVMAVRRMSAAGLVFKGSGFYITDYGKDGKKDERAATAARAAASKPEASGSDTAVKAPEGGEKSAESSGKAEKSGGKPEKGGEPSSASPDKPAAAAPAPAPSPKKSE